MKKLMSISLAMAMTLSLSAAAFAWDYNMNELSIEQDGAFNEASIEQNIVSFPYDRGCGNGYAKNEASIVQSGLMNQACIDQSAYKGVVNTATINQCGFANSASGYQH